jgi:glycosyltransferase involved in cell wall biosynthesis
MAAASLTNIYSLVHPKAKQVFVVPLIRLDFPKTDYLYLLYASLIGTDSRYHITSLSAIQHYKLIISRLSGKSAILHYHWLEFQDAKSFLAMPYKLLCLSLFHLLGGKIVWTVHNIQPHNRRFLAFHLKLHRWMSALSSAVLVHSSTAKSLVAKAYQLDERKMHVVPHPKFPATLIEQKKAREKIGIPYSDSVVLMPGAISAYKGIEESVLLFSELEHPPRLLVAGYVKKGQEELHQQLLDWSQNFSWLDYRPGFISDDAFAFYLNSADVCLFNFSEMLTSGSIEMALAYQKPVILRANPALKELSAQEQVFIFDNRSTFFSQLQSALLTSSHGKLK